METVAIIGGGITGLTAAFFLQQRGIPVTVYEASPRAGGVIQTTTREGFLVENGPNTILESAAEVSVLIDELGLAARRLDAALAARYLVRDGKMIRLPQSAVEGLRTPLLSWRAKLRVGAEPFIERGTADDETLADFVRRRLGPEILDYCIDPFVVGVYAGNPERLSVRHAFPKLYALEQRYGSLIKGTILGARERKRRGTKSKASAPMLSFDAGLGVLVDALADRLGAALRLDAPVSRIEKADDAWIVHTVAGEKRRHSTVLLCVPAHRAAQIDIDGVEEMDIARIRYVYYPPIARVALGFQKERIAHSLEGFGVLIPSRERMNSLGILFSSSLFPNRAPEGYAVLTAFLGGSRNPDILRATDAGLVELALEDMRKLLGVSSAPVFQDVVRIPFAIPQYNVGYGEVKAAIDRMETEAPGVLIAANYRNGISVADCIVSGKTASERVLRHVGHAHLHAA